MDAILFNLTNLFLFPVQKRQFFTKQFNVPLSLPPLKLLKSIDCLDNRFLLPSTHPHICQDWSFPRFPINWQYIPSWDRIFGQWERKEGCRVIMGEWRLISPLWLTIDYIIIMAWIILMMIILLLVYCLSV